MSNYNDIRNGLGQLPSFVSSTNHMLQLNPHKIRGQVPTKQTKKHTISTKSETYPSTPKPQTSIKMTPRIKYLMHETIMVNINKLK